jgi:pilus assembly protein CpaE
MRSSLKALTSSLLTYSQVSELHSYPTRAVLEEALIEYGVTLCLVDSTTNQDWAQALLSDLAMLNAKLPVVAVHGQSDPDFILRTLRAGATEVLIQPFGEDQFVSVIERLNATHGSCHRSGKLIALIPAKGACGASTLACSLVHYAHRANMPRALLADLDPLTGTIPFLLKLKSGYSFVDALTRGHSMDEDIWKGLVANWSGIDVLLSPEQPAHGIDLQSDASGLLQFAGMIYDLVVTDTNVPYGPWALSIARQADEVLLVTTNELSSLQAAQKALAYFDRNRVERSKVRVVVNRFSKEFGLSQEVIEAALHTEVYHTIPNDFETISRSLVEGRAISSATPVGCSIQSLVEKLTGKPIRSENPKPSSLTNLFGFLRR